MFPLNELNCFHAHDSLYILSERYDLTVLALKILKGSRVDHNKGHASHNSYWSKKEVSKKARPAPAKTF